LDTVLPDLRFPVKDRLLLAMDGHIVDQGSLVGTYTPTPVPRRDARFF
jgi:hypothetical protein